MVQRYCLLICGVFLLNSVASAADFTWTNPAGGNFVGNFTPGGTPVSAIDTRLIFPDLLALPTGYTAVNNLGSFTLNAVQFNSFGSPNPAAVTISAGAAAGFTLRFAANGAIQPSILQNGTGAAVIQNGLATTGITLSDGTNLTIGGTGLGSLLCSATIAQAAGGVAAVTYNRSGPLASGIGVTTISGLNTYTGGTSIVSGHIAVANNSAFGTGPVTIDGTEHLLSLPSGFTISSPFVLNQSLRITNILGSMTFSGAISGPGGLTFENSNNNILNTGTSNFTFTGPGTATGTLTNGDGRGAGRHVTFAGPSGTTRYSSFVVGPTSTLSFDNTNATATRVNAAVPPPLTLHSSAVEIIGQSFSANVASETFGMLNVSSHNVLSATPGSSNNASLRFAGLTRELNATLEFVGTNIGSSGNNTSNFVFLADPGGSIGGILPYAVASPTATADNRTLVRYDAATGRIISLNVATDYNPVDLYVAGQSNPGGNFRRAVTSATPNAGSAAGLVGPITVNALVLEGAALGGSATLTVAGGSLVQSATETGGALGQINLGGLNFGGNSAYIHSLRDQVINAPISGSGGIVKSGEGTLTLTTANSFSGGLTINAGTVYFATDAALGAAGGSITLNHADVSSSSDTDGLQFALISFDPSPATTMTTTRPIAVGPVGGNLNTSIANGTWTIAGPITGSGGLRISRGPFEKNGLVVLSGVNSNTGPLNVEGALAIASDDALGAPNSPLILAGELRVDGSFATPRPVIMMGGAVVLPPGRSLQLDGPITGTGLKVLGAGELTVTSANLYRGSIRIGEDSFSRSLFPVLPAGALSGASFTLRGPNAAMPLLGSSGGSSLVAQGGAFHLDNSGPAVNANSNRISGAGFFLSGGELKLTGNAAVDVSETLGSLTSDRFLGTVTLDQPDSGGAGRQSTIIATGYFPGTNATLRDVLFVRGTNLGATAGDRTALLLNSDPLPINGLIEGVVGGTTATGSPTDFAAATPVGTQFAVTTFNAYAGQLPASGGSATATYDNTSVSVVTGNVAAHAVRLSAGGGIQMNTGTIMTFGSGMVLALPGNAGISGGRITTAKPFRLVNTGDLSIGTAADPTTIAAANGFIKAGTGRLTLFGTASTTLGSVGAQPPTVTVAEGTLALGNGQALVNSSLNNVNGVLPEFHIDSRATLDLSLLSGPVRVRGLEGFGAVQIGSNTLQIGDGQSQFSGSLVGSAASTFMVGTPQSEASGNTFESEIRLLGDNSGFAGGFTVLRGTLGLWSSLSAGSGTSPIILGDTSGTGGASLSLGPGFTLTRDIIVRAGASPSAHGLFGGMGDPHALPVGAVQTVSGNIILGKSLQITGTSDGNTLFFTGTISGAGGLQKSSINTVFTGDNTFSGGFTTSGDGIIGLGSNSTATTGPLGTGPVQLGDFVISRFLAYGGPRTLSNPVSTIGTRAFLRIDGLNDLTFTGSLNYTTLTQAFQLTSNSAGVTTFSGPISGSQQFQKNGVGTVVFANPTGNPYAGNTLLNAGTLIAANTSGSATGTGTVTVNPGAILGGTGRVGGATTLTTGGILRPGANETTPGTLTFGGNVTVQNRAILSVTVDGSNAGELQLAGGFFDLTGANSLTVYVTGSAPMTPESYTIVDSGAIPIAFFNGAFSESNFAVSANFPFGSLILTNPTPTTLVLNYVPVPEPLGILFVVAAAAWGTQQIRRRKVWPTAT